MMTVVYKNFLSELFTKTPPLMELTDLFPSRYTVLKQKILTNSTRPNVISLLKIIVDVVTGTSTTSL